MLRARGARQQQAAVERRFSHSPGPALSRIAPCIQLAASTIARLKSSRGICSASSCAATPSRSPRSAVSNSISSVPRSPSRRSSAACTASPSASGASTSVSGIPNSTPSSENMPVMKPCSWVFLSSPRDLASSSSARARIATRASSMAERTSPWRAANSIRLSQRRSCWRPSSSSACEKLVMRRPVPMPSELTSRSRLYDSVGSRRSSASISWVSASAATSCTICSALHARGGLRAAGLGRRRHAPVAVDPHRGRRQVFADQAVVGAAQRARRDFLPAGQLQCRGQRRIDQRTVEAGQACRPGRGTVRCRTAAARRQRRRRRRRSAGRRACRCAQPAREKTPAERESKRSCLTCQIYTVSGYGNPKLLISANIHVDVCISY